MNDQELVDYIYDAYRALRSSVVLAEEKGISVHLHGITVEELSRKTFTLFEKKVVTKSIIKPVSKGRALQEKYPGARVLGDVD